MSHRRLEPAESALPGRFDQPTLLGVGGQSRVYSAFDREFGHRVAVRATPSALGEFELRAELRHPSIVSVLDVMRGPQTDWLVEELVDGERLRGGDDVAQFGRVARSLLVALRYLHDSGIAHRDLKPANVLVGSDGEPVLLDFGLASRIERGAPETRPGTLGTVAPEVLEGRVDPIRADLFGLGTTMLAFALGIEPRAEWSVDADALRRALDAAPEAVRLLLSGLTHTAKSERFVTAGEALQSLGSIAPAKCLAPGSASSWPIVGRRGELASIVGHLNGDGRPRRVAVLTGTVGAGKASLAELARRKLAVRGCRAAILRVDSAAELWRVMRADSTAILVTTEDREVAAHLVAALGSDTVLPIDIAPLDRADVASLVRWLPVAAHVDPSLVFRESGGHPGAMRSILTNDQDDREIDPAEAWIAIRGFAAPMDGLDGAAVDTLRHAVSKGAIEFDRGRGFRLRSPSRRRYVLENVSVMELRRLHQDASVGGSAWHGFLAGNLAGNADDAEAALRALEADLAADELAISIEHAIRLRGPDALRVAAFAGIARRLAAGGHLAPIRTILGIECPDEPAQLVALRSFLASERGDVREALRLADAALHADGPLAFPALLDLARALQWGASYDKALDVLVDADRHAASEVDRAEVARLRSLVLFRAGRRAEARTCAIEGIETIGDRAPRIRIGLMQNLALIERHFGDHEAAARLLDEAGHAALELADVRGAAVSWINSGLAREDAGDLVAARADRERAASISEVAGLAQPRDVARASLAMNLARFGAWPHAASELDAIVISMEAQGLHREPRIASLAALDARLQATADDRYRRQLEERLHAAVRDGAPAEAAVAWRALLQSGSTVEVAPRDARKILHSADRSTRELIRVALHEQRDTDGAGRSRNALVRIVRRGLPRARLFAAMALLGRAHDTRERRSFGARVLLEAKKSQSPADRIAAYTACIGTAGRPRILARRILDELATLERLATAPVSEPSVKPWTSRIEELRQTVQALALPHKHADDLSGLLRVQRLLLDSAADDAARFRAILEEAMQISGAARGMIIVRDRGALRIVAALQDEQGTAREFVAEEAMEFSRNLLDEVLETGSPRITVNALEDPAWQWANSVVDFRLASIACVPVKVGDRVAGALYLDNPFEKGRFSDDIATQLEMFGMQVSIGFDAARKRDEIEKLNDDLRGRLARAEAQLDRERIGQDIIATSPRMVRVLERVRRLAATELPVHIHGETGTGKELIARKLHECSTRRDGPFVTENCSAIASELLESELFGHVKGAFTGATRDKPGLLRTASGGTLFLDEIGDMPLPLQARILRVLQEGEIRPVGGDETVHVDVRIITATHRDLREMVAKGEFREDLYYRIVVASVDLPPLRERPEDVRVLAAHFLERFGRPGQVFDASAISRLESHSWPGNVRELESAIRSTCVLAKDKTISASDLPPQLASPTRTGVAGSGLPVCLEDLEKIAIARALELAGGNRGEAAKLLGISRSSVFVKIRKYGLADSKREESMQ
ncbi:MAG: sigma 54-interacting transcriptional regulator [Planctomycetes bacterium]|nr:sigma 54-interacting transcriptional regulator [Planctomycetota bacterium]